jgi:hypothetical protein
MAAKKKHHAKKKTHHSGGKKKHYAKKSHAHRAYKSNPKKHHKKRKTYTSHKKRHHTKRRSNPFGLSGGILGEAISYSVAGFAITIGNGYVQPVVSRFVPGQFAAPVSKAVTGFGLGWIAGKFSFTSRFKRPLQILGVALAVTDLVKPFISGFLGGAQATGMHGRGMRGIAPWGGVPQFASQPQKVVSSGGPQGIAPYAGVPQMRAV